MQLSVDCLDRFLYIQCHLFLAPRFLRVQIQQQSLHVSVKHLTVEYSCIHEHATLTVCLVHRRRWWLELLLGYRFLNQARKLLVGLLFAAVRLFKRLLNHNAWQPIINLAKWVLFNKILLAQK